MYSKLPLVLDGVGEIPSITNSIPGLSIPSNFFGIRVPRGVPMEVVETMNMAWENVTMNSEALRAYSADRGALFNPLYGDATVIEAMSSVTHQAWTLYDGGKAVMSPEAAGIPRP